MTLPTWLTLDFLYTFYIIFGLGFFGLGHIIIITIIIKYIFLLPPIQFLFQLYIQFETFSFEFFQRERKKLLTWGHIRLSLLKFIFIIDIRIRLKILFLFTISSYYYCLNIMIFMLFKLFMGFDKNWVLWSFFSFFL